MKIDSGLSGYSYPNRTTGVDRKQDEPQAAETHTRKASSGSLTGASTFASSSLSNALWMMSSADDTSAAASEGADFATSGGVTQDWVAGLYQEFA